MLTIEFYCNKCEEWLNKSRSKGNCLMILCGIQISDAFSMVIGYSTTSGPIRKKPNRITISKGKIQRHFWLASEYSIGFWIQM
jgi:hypothetical protein